MGIEKPKLSLVIPVYNEGFNIDVTLRIIYTLLDFPFEILIVYDFPQDTTIPVIEKLQPRYPNIRLVHNQIGRGVPNAVKTGIQNAEGEYVAIYAIDEVFPLLGVNDMVQLLDEGCDFVAVTRYAYGGARLGGSPIGKFLSTWANRLFNLFSCSSFTDCTTGLKMFRKTWFNTITLQSKPVGWSFAFELAILALQTNAVIGEVPVISIDRLFGGQSSFKVGSWMREYLIWFFYGIRKLPFWKPKKKIKVRIPSALI